MTTREKIIAAAREAGFDDRQWESMTYDSGPYEVTTPKIALERFYTTAFDAGQKSLRQQLSAARADNIRLREAINAAEIDGEEVLDFDEFTAYMIPLDTYHALTDALAATADLGRYVICESEPVAWLWQRNHSNGGYTREVCQFESKARDLAEDGKTLPTPDSVTPLYRKAEL